MTNENKINLLKILSLTFIITGAITFLIAMIHWDKEILLWSLIQLMGGSAGCYLIPETKKPPILYKGEAH